MIQSLLITQFHHFINISDFQENYMTLEPFGPKQRKQIRVFFTTSIIQNCIHQSSTMKHYFCFNFRLFVIYLYLTWSQVRLCYLGVQVAQREKLQRKPCLFLTAPGVCIRSLFRQNFWLFANWRQDWFDVLHILWIPKQIRLV